MVGKCHPANTGRVPPDESNGVGRGKQSWSEGEGGPEGGKERKEEEEWEGGPSVSEFNQGKGKQGGGEKGEVGVPSVLEKSCPGTGRGKHIAELIAGWSPSPCSSEKKPNVATLEASEIGLAGRR